TVGRQDVDDRRRNEGGGNDLHEVEFLIAAGFLAKQGDTVNGSRTDQRLAVQKEKDIVVGRVLDDKPIGGIRLQCELAGQAGGGKRNSNIIGTVAIRNNI